MTELNLWQKCYVMGQMLATDKIPKPAADEWADWPVLLAEVASLLDQASEQLSPRGRSEQARLS